jgi:hypothetical protein
VLQCEIELLRERLTEKNGVIDDLRSDREEWRKDADGVAIITWDVPG